MLPTRLNPFGYSSSGSNPFDPETVIQDITNGASVSDNLPPGVYMLYITGGGGNGAGWAFNGYPWTNGGGSAATFEGEFYNPKLQPYTLTAGAALQDSIFVLGGVTVINAGKGNNGAAFGNPGSGGTLVINSGFQIVGTPQKQTNGNAGLGTALAYDREGGASTSSFGWGAGHWVKNSSYVQYGGCKLIYKRFKP